MTARKSLSKHSVNVYKIIKQKRINKNIERISFESSSDNQCKIKQNSILISINFIKTNESAEDILHLCRKERIRKLIIQNELYTLLVNLDKRMYERQSVHVYIHCPFCIHHQVFKMIMITYHFLILSAISNAISEIL